MKMTLNDIHTSPRLWLTAEEIAPIIGCNAHAIRVQAHEDPGKLAFPVVVIGRRVRIPRVGFLAAIEGGNDNVR